MTLDKLDNISGYVIIILGLYFIVAATISPYKVFGKTIQSIIDNNPFFHHIITFIVIFALIILLNKTPPSVPLQGLYAIINNPSDELLYLFGVSVLIYIIFIISSRAPLIFTILLLTLLIILFVINSIALKKKEEKNEDEYKKYKLIKNILFIFILIISVIGTIIYSLEKYKNEKFTFLTYILDKKSNNN